MRKTIAKQLRAITNPKDNSINKRVYKRLKKQYNKVPHHARRDFIEATKQFYELVEKQSGKPMAQAGQGQ
jgi:hypothetical protein